ncbi:nucleotidyltransferase domain-containing protein [Micromonospora chersina]|uniref:nucleotidyltransferase domain-containing protein n=1 Tax=Micromonospora chersina TaxID=47854 RepID=UPI00371FBFD8
MDLEALSALARQLVAVEGVVAVALGGSRARGTHRPDSDIDLGLYYRGGLDVDALGALAAKVADSPAGVTEPGGWGPWVDGGGWLTVEGWRVDWIYRRLDRVERVWKDCQVGRYDVGIQPGHPLGFYTHAYAGEVALCRVLADPTGELTYLRAQTRQYPSALSNALVEGLWEADFITGSAKYGAAGNDPTYAAGCLFRAVGVACHALHGHARQWLINEKGMVAMTAALPVAPPDFAERVHALLASPGRSQQEIAETVSRAEALIAEVRRATCGPQADGK